MQVISCGVANSPKSPVYEANRRWPGKHQRGLHYPAGEARPLNRLSRKEFSLDRPIRFGDGAEKTRDHYLPTR